MPTTRWSARLYDDIGGMAHGLAGSMDKPATVGLAAAIVSPSMNISGSLLAPYWSRRSVPPTEENS